MEVGPKDYTHQYTGRSVTIPNSIFLTKNVINETFSTDYVLHVFIVPIKKDSNWEIHKKALLDSATSKCEQYIDKGIKHFSMIANKRQLDIPKIHPRVNVKLTGADNIDLVVRVTIPSRIRGTVEQEIINEYLNLVIK
jgi:small-conductance mechanosensitive channel